MLFPNLLLRYWLAANYNYLLNRVTKYTLVIHMYHIISDEIGTHKGKFKIKAPRVNLLEGNIKWNRFRTLKTLGKEYISKGK